MDAIGTELEADMAILDEGMQWAQNEEGYRDARVSKTGINV